MWLCTVHEYPRLTVHEKADFVTVVLVVAGKSTLFFCKALKYLVVFNKKDINTVH
jgi:hypothetical protein